MSAQIYNYIQKHFQQDPHEVNKLLVSAFCKINNLKTSSNAFLKAYIIDKKNLLELKKINEFVEITEKLFINFSLETLIEVFEFVISPADRIINGAVYTPRHIREYIISKTIEKSNNLKVADIACGCGGFLLTAAQHIQKLTGKPYAKIYLDNLWGLDIVDYSVERTKIILSLLALENGEDVDFKFNLFVGNALDFNWSEKSSIINDNRGFDLILGNPPYVCSRNIDEKNRILLDKWEVTKSGHPDLYIPFFQIALENLREGGVLGYITVNTFFKSVNGRSLRAYFSRNSFSFKIIDFKDEQVFKKRNTYTCICLITKTYSSHVDYASTNSSSLTKEINYTVNDYLTLDNVNGWNLVSKKSYKAILKKMEETGSKIFFNFSFSTGIATLKNQIYIFKPVRQDRFYYYLKKDDVEYPIEKNICREVINSNRVTDEDSIQILKRKIIFPYKWNKEKKKYLALTANEFKKEYPNTYSYLEQYREILANRDKGQGEYEKWFAFGRTQGLNVKGYKLFLPHITNNPRFVLSNEEKLLFCNGEAIVSENETELKILKKVLESKIFWFYIKSTSKPYSSGYLSFGKNYLKQFSIPNLDEKEKKFLLGTSDKEKILNFLLKKYDLKKADITI